jgi:hypothetical protein
VAKSSYRWPEVAAFFFSIVAIVISGYSLLEGRWQHQDERNTEMLDAIYEDWNAQQGEEWYKQHLYEAPDTYREVRDLARRLTAAMNDQQKVELFLGERAAANIIFTNFEHLLKQWNLAVALDDDTRLGVLKEEVDFYAEVLLRNPRLLWFWSDDGGRWIHQADPSTVVFYEQRVLNDPAHPLTVRPDAEGILPGFN